MASLYGGIKVLMQDQILEDGKGTGNSISFMDRR